MYFNIFNSASHVNSIYIYTSIYKLWEGLSGCLSVNNIFKLDRFFATGTSKCSVKFDIVWIRNVKYIVKYIGKRR